MDLILTMTTFGQRLREARERKQLTQAQLSMKMGGKPSQGQIAKLESGERPRTTYLAEFAAALEVNEKWLQHGRGLRGIHANVEEGPEIGGRVPLISWVQAGSWNQAADPFPPGGGDYVESPIAIKEGMYALTVRGDSMFNPAGPKSYPDGCRIFVDPSLRDPVNGQRVIAKIEGEDEVTFKVFVKDGARIFLRPLNPQYPAIMEHFRVLGTVVAKAELE